MIAATVPKVIARFSSLYAQLLSVHNPDINYELTFLHFALPHSPLARWRSLPEGHRGGHEISVFPSYQGGIRGG
jgi:hypothetical protein